MNFEVVLMDGRDEILAIPGKFPSEKEAMQEASRKNKYEGYPREGVRYIALRSPLGGGDLVALG